MRLTRAIRHCLIIPLLFISTLSRSAENTASVSYMEGTVSKSRDGKDWKPLSKGDTLAENESVKTGVKSRLELTLPDGSKMRFSEGTNFKVDSLMFKEEERSLGIDVLFGKAWAKVTKEKKGSRFEVKTPNAVAGVRGTVYRVDVNNDTSSLVRVYDGEVAVGNLPAKIEDEGKRPKYISGPSEIPGPHEVTREEWTYIVKSWQQIAISPKGIASKPTSFTQEEDRNEWVIWNQEMDR